MGTCGIVERRWRVWFCNSTFFQDRVAAGVQDGRSLLPLVFSILVWWLCRSAYSCCVTELGVRSGIATNYLVVALALFYPRLSRRVRALNLTLFDRYRFGHYNCLQQKQNKVSDRGAGGNAVRKRCAEALCGRTCIGAPSHVLLASCKLLAVVVHFVVHVEQLLIGRFNWNEGHWKYVPRLAWT